MLDTLIEAGGWAGMLMVLGAYVAVSTGRLEARSTLSFGLNMTGSTLLAVSAASNTAWAIFTLNTIWALVAAWGLWRLGRRHPPA